MTALDEQSVESGTAEVHPAGSVSTVRAEWGRHWTHQASIGKLAVPEGTFIGMAPGGNVAENRNKAAESFAGDWLMMVDDDQVVLRQTLHHMLTTLYSGPFDMVSALVLQREIPFQTLAWKWVGLDRERLVGWQGEGPIEVDEVGLGCTVIRRRLLDGLEKPWFRLGEIAPDQLGEDIGFCRRARRAGFRIAVDRSAPIGHGGYFIVHPDPVTGHVRLVCGEGEYIMVRPPPPDAVIPRLPELMGL